MQDSSHNPSGGVVSGINVTPLVDIMLVLLIIFMVTANFVSESNVKVNLPKIASKEESAAHTPSLPVILDASGVIRLSDQNVDLNGLKSNLRRESQKNPGIRVALSADGSVPYARVAEVLDAIKLAGVARVALVGQRP